MYIILVDSRAILRLLIQISLINLLSEEIIYMLRELNVSGKIFQLSRTMHLLKIPIIPKFLKQLNRIIFSCDIPYNTDIKNSVMFGHNGMGLVINKNAKIDENTLIMQHVTIGANMGKFRVVDGKKITAPYIGKNVLISAGAILLGPIVVGDNAQIGAGAVVTKDVPENGVAVGVPAKVVKVLNKNEIKEVLA
ncbi:serine acetyltransferase [Ruoffia tabacinasalis]|uniref:Serine acetyltransferase n=1 Tax=Ruoffia tabacinasalis TaxID=87458 RepID=A0A5R9DVA6_9LACT|nr:serine acetyltransferase [Ruoffia tabacinasalis]